MATSRVRGYHHRPGADTFVLLKKAFLNNNGALEEKIVNMPHDATLPAWWHPHRMLRTNTDVAFPPSLIAPLVTLQQKLARLYINKLSEDLEKDDEAARKSCSEVLLTWSCTKTWRHIWAPILPDLPGVPKGKAGKARMTKEKHLQAIILWAEQGLSDDDQQIIDEAFGHDSVSQYATGHQAWPASPFPRYHAAAATEVGESESSHFLSAIHSSISSIGDVAVPQLMIAYTKNQLSLTLAGLLKSNRSAPAHHILYDGLSPSRLAEVLVTIATSEESALTIDLERTFGRDWENLQSLSAHHSSQTKARRATFDAAHPDRVRGDGGPLSKKAFFGRMARQATIRQLQVPASDPAFDKKRNELYILFNQLWNEMEATGEPQCPCCGVKLTLEYQPQAKGSPREAYPTNASPDRLATTGCYEAGNVRLTCVACNLIRGRNSVSGGQRHVKRMKDAWKSGFCEVVDGYLRPTLEPVPVSAVDAGFIEKWAKTKFRSIEKRVAENPSKKCTLSVQDLIGIVKASWDGDGSFIDVTGARFSLSAGSFDRKDSKQGYTLGNVRLMHWGLNHLKNACVDDRYIVQWLDA